METSIVNLQQKIKYKKLWTIIPKWVIIEDAKHIPQQVAVQTKEYLYP